MLLSIAEVFFKFFVEAGQGRSPFLFAFLDFVQLFFQPRCVLRIEDVRKVCHQQIGHYQSDFCGQEFSAQFLHILALLDRGEDGSVSRRASNASLFQLLHQ